MLEGHNNEATAILNTLSSKEQVLARVMDIIKDKPVFVTLRKIMDGRTTGRYEILKGLSSLFTHVAIECEKGSVEYAEILKDIHSLLGEKLYE